MSIGSWTKEAEHRAAPVQGRPPVAAPTGARPILPLPERLRGGLPPLRCAVMSPPLLGLMTALGLRRLRRSPADRLHYFAI